MGGGVACVGGGVRGAGRKGNKGDYISRWVRNSSFMVGPQTTQRRPLSFHWYHGEAPVEALKGIVSCHKMNNFVEGSVLFVRALMVFTKLCCLLWRKLNIKGQCHEIFDFRFFFHESVSPSPWESHYTYKFWNPNWNTFHYSLFCFMVGPQTTQRRPLSFHWYHGEAPVEALKGIVSCHKMNNFVEGSVLFVRALMVFTKLCCLLWRKLNIKGQCHEIFDFRFFFHESVSPSPWESHYTYKFWNPNWNTFHYSLFCHWSNFWMSISHWMQKKITVYGRLFEGFPSHCSRLKISHVKASEMVIMQNLNLIISWTSYFFAWSKRYSLNSLIA